MVTPIAKVQFPTITAMPTGGQPNSNGEAKDFWILVSPAMIGKGPSEELDVDDLEYGSPCEQRGACLVMTKRVRTSP